jgi:hypothetical protein
MPPCPGRGAARRGAPPPCRGSLVGIGGAWCTPRRSAGLAGMTRGWKQTTWPPGQDARGGMRNQRIGRRGEGGGAGVADAPAAGLPVARVGGTERARHRRRHGLQRGRRHDPFLPRGARAARTSWGIAAMTAINADDRFVRRAVELLELGSLSEADAARLRRARARAMAQVSGPVVTLPRVALAMAAVASLVIIGLHLFRGGEPEPPWRGLERLELLAGADGGSLGADRAGAPRAAPAGRAPVAGHDCGAAPDCPPAAV